MDSASIDAGGAQATRRSSSGVRRFSTGMCSDCASSSIAGLAAFRRASASGARSAHALTGGIVSVFRTRSGGRSGSARPASNAAHHRSSSERLARPVNSLTAASCCLVFGSARIAATRARSGTSRPGETSCVIASSSRASHSARAIASPRRPRTVWRPLSRRQGSSRGGLGSRVRTAENSCAANAVLPASASCSTRMSRTSIRYSTSSAAYSSHACGRGRVDQSDAECAFARVTPRVSSTTAPRPTRSRPRSRDASSVSKIVGGSRPSSRREGRS